jgi:hypothetical protein
MMTGGGEQGAEKERSSGVDEDIRVHWLHPCPNRGL